MIKITITGNTRVSSPVILSHHGVHLKRSLGGPPWYRHINGIAIRLPGFRLLWIELFKPFRRGRTFVNLTKGYNR